MGQIQVNILGTPYKVITKKYDEDEVFERRSLCGYCDGYTKTPFGTFRV